MAVTLKNVAPESKLSLKHFNLKVRVMEFIAVSIMTDCYFSQAAATGGGTLHSNVQTPSVTT